MTSAGIPSSPVDQAAVVSLPAIRAKRGRPRSKEADSAILRAATELLSERGLGGMSIEEVASRAGVGKATVYRRWSSRGALALDAFVTEFLGRQPPPDTGTLYGDMLAALRAWIAVTRTGVGDMLVGLIAEGKHDPALAAAWKARVVEPVRAQHSIMLDRAIARGEIAADTDKEVVIDMLYGPGYFRLMNPHQPLTDEFARRVVDLLVAGLTLSGAVGN